MLLSSHHSLAISFHKTRALPWPNQINKISNNSSLLESNWRLSCHPIRVHHSWPKFQIQRKRRPRLLLSRKASPRKATLTPSTRHCTPLARSRRYNWRSRSAPLTFRSKSTTKTSRVAPHIGRCSRPTTTTRGGMTCRHSWRWMGSKCCRKWLSSSSSSSHKTIKISPWTCTRTWVVS